MAVDLAPVRRAAARRRKADEEYGKALVAAYRGLVASGDSRPFATIAAELGCARQVVRRYVLARIESE